MNLWQQYRIVWISHPWVFPIALAGLILTVAGIVGTITTSGYALVFLPGLALLFLHHLLVAKRTP